LEHKKRESQKQHLGSNTQSAIAQEENPLFNWGGWEERNGSGKKKGVGRIVSLALLVKSEEKRGSTLGGEIQKRQTSRTKMKKEEGGGGNCQLEVGRWFNLRKTLPGG